MSTVCVFVCLLICMYVCMQICMISYGYIDVNMYIYAYNFGCCVVALQVLINFLNANY